MQQKKYINTFFTFYKQADYILRMNVSHTCRFFDSKVRKYTKSKSRAYSKYIYISILLSAT